MSLGTVNTKEFLNQPPAYSIALCTFENVRYRLQFQIQPDLVMAAELLVTSALETTLRNNDRQRELLVVFAAYLPSGSRSGIFPYWYLSLPWQNVTSTVLHLVICNKISAPRFRALIPICMPTPSSPATSCPAPCRERSRPPVSS